MKNLAKYIRCESITQAQHLFDDVVKEYRSCIQMTYRYPRILVIHFKSDAVLYFIAECHWDSVMEGKQHYTEISGSEFEAVLNNSWSKCCFETGLNPGKSGLKSGLKVGF